MTIYKFKYNANLQSSLTLKLLFLSQPTHADDTETLYPRRPKQVDRQYCGFYSVYILLQHDKSEWPSLAPFFAMELARSLATCDVGNAQAMDEIWGAVAAGGLEADTIVSILRMLGLQVASTRFRVIRSSDYHQARYDINKPFLDMYPPGYYYLYPIGYFHTQTFRSISFALLQNRKDGDAAAMDKLFDWASINQQTGGATQFDGVASISGIIISEGNHHSVVSPDVSNKLLVDHDTLEPKTEEISVQSFARRSRSEEAQLIFVEKLSQTKSAKKCRSQQIKTLVQESTTWLQYVLSTILDMDKGYQRLLTQIKCTFF